MESKANNPIQYLINNGSNSQIQKPVFHSNPLKMLAVNTYSGTLHISNLTHINKLYEIMRDALICENNQQQQEGGSIYQGYNMEAKPLTMSNKIFTSMKGQKIFHIYKDTSNINESRNYENLNPNILQYNVYNQYNEMNSNINNYMYSQGYDNYLNLGGIGSNVENLNNMLINYNQQYNENMVFNNLNENQNYANSYMYKPDKEEDEEYYEAYDENAPEDEILDESGNQIVHNENEKLIDGENEEKLLAIKNEMAGEEEGFGNYFREMLN